MSETTTPPAPLPPAPLPTNEFRLQAFSLLSAGSSNFTNPVASNLSSITNILPNLSSRIESYISNTLDIPSNILSQLNEFKSMISTGGAFLTSMTGFLNHTNITSGVIPGTAALPGISARMGFASAGMRIDATQGTDAPCGAVGELFASILEGVQMVEDIASYVINLINSGIDYIIQQISNIINFINEQIQAVAGLIQREIDAVLRYAEKIATAALTSALEDLLGNECTAGVVSTITNPQVVGLLQQSRALR